MKQQQAQTFVFVIGTRAQLIKVAPVIVGCENKGIACKLLMTGQHFETIHDLLDEFGVTSKPVNVSPAGERATVLSLFMWLPKAFIGLVKVLKELGVRQESSPILVHGDTLSTLLGAIAGRTVGGTVVHLESGLTSGRLFDPFPEELVRRIVFKLSHVAMCPSAKSAEHMKKKHPKCKIVNTRGNTILDAIDLTNITREKIDPANAYIVASLHRFQNIYDTPRLEELVALLKAVSRTHHVIFVMHPATQKRLIKKNLYEGLADHDRVKLTPRLGYCEFLRLAAGSACVLTDGGSNQEELAALGVPTIVMRQTTEREDGLGHNAVMENELNNGVLSFIESREYFKLERTTTMDKAHSPTEMILKHIT